MDIKDYIRGTELHFGERDTHGEMEVIATSDQGDTVWFYITEEQAKDVMTHLRQNFDV